MDVDPERIDGRRARYQHRRPELLDAVADYVVEHGVTGVAMRPLAAAVGVSHGTLLHHFGSKENLLTEVIERLRQRLTDAVGLTSAPVHLDDLTTWWRSSTSTDQLTTYRLLFEVFAQAVRQPEQYERFLQQVVRDARALLESLVLVDGCPRERAPAAASMIMGQARGLQLELLVTDDAERVDQAFVLFIEMLERLRRAWGEGP